MNYTCSNCNSEVPEGASACLTCGASIGTVLLGKKSLTRTLIDKALELRKSIPWVGGSSVKLLGDSGGRRKAFVVALAVLIGGGAVAGGVMWYRKGGAAAVGKIVLSTKSSDEDTKPSRETRSSRKEEAPAPSRSASTARPTPVVAKKSGTLAVNAVHKGKPVKGAKVWVNGENKGQTPMTVPLASGTYTVKIEKAGYRTEKRPGVKVQPGKKVALKVDLKK